MYVTLLAKHFVSFLHVHCTHFLLLAAAAASQSPEASPTDVVPDCYPTTPPQPEPCEHTSRY